MPGESMFRRQPSQSQRKLPIARVFPILIVLILSACATAGGQPGTATPSNTLKRPPAPVLGKFDPASVRDIKIEDYPVVPAVSPAMREVYQAGLQQGNDPNVFAKLGDCMTENPYFLGPFSAGTYELGE